MHHQHPVQGNEDSGSDDTEGSKTSDEDRHFVEDDPLFDDVEGVAESLRKEKANRQTSTPAKDADPHA